MLLAAGPARSRVDRWVQSAGGSREAPAPVAAVSVCSFGAHDFWNRSSRDTEDDPVQSPDGACDVHVTCVRRPAHMPTRHVTHGPQGPLPQHQAAHYMGVGAIRTGHVRTPLLTTEPLKSAPQGHTLGTSAHTCTARAPAVPPVRSGPTPAPAAPESRAGGAARLDSGGRAPRSQPSPRSHGAGPQCQASPSSAVPAVPARAQW